jgi:hypothetical protein
MFVKPESRGGAAPARVVCPPGTGWPRDHAPRYGAKRRRTSVDYAYLFHFWYRHCRSGGASILCPTHRGNREERGDGLELSLAYPQISPRMPVLASMVWG